jgi:hypothetical protein
MKRTMMGLVVVFLLGLALGIGGTLGVQAVTDDPAPSFRSEVRERLAEEWGDMYAECIEEARTRTGFEQYGARDDSSPEVATETERLECKRTADAILP